MATCNLYFYRCNITPDKNRVYDQYQNFEVLDAMYGATKMYEKLNFQYQKLSLHMNIKVSFEQRVQYSQSVNYLKLVDTTNYNVIYFFITKFEWVAQNTIRCELYMDTMQTYKAVIENYITSSTFVMREHSDRAYDDNGTIKRIISKTDEGVGVVSQELQRHGSLEINNSLQRHKGYIGYVKNIEGSSDNPSPLSTIIFSDYSFKIIDLDYLTQSYKEFATQNALEAEITSNYKGLVITQLDSPNFKYDCNGVEVEPFGTTRTIDNVTCYCRAVYITVGLNSDNQYVPFVYFLYYSGTTYPYTPASTYESSGYEWSIKLYNVMYARRVESILTLNRSYSYLNNILNDDQTLIYEVGENLFNPENLATPSTFDFSDSFLMKVVELPFFPPVFRSQSMTVKMATRLPTGYYYNFHYKALQKSSTQDDFPAVTYSDLSIGINSSFTNVGTSLVTKKIDNESKLYNSSFYTCKFVYGADTKELKLENLSIDTISVIGYAPKNMSSTLLFDFQLTTSTYKGLDDYFEYLTTTRNNEVPVYNSGYLDYIRLQYSTDKANLKQAQDQKIASLAGGITTSVAGTAASIAGGAIAGASAGSSGGAIGAIIGGVVGVVSSAISIGLSINNTSNSIAQENRNFSSKLNALVAQNVSLSGNVDIDILDKMNRNSLNLYLYQAPDHIRQQLFDKFYYTGYSVGYRKHPDFTSRRLFNFVQCVPVFDNASLRISKEYLDDIVNRFSQGVTFMHVYDYQNSKTYYDETQQYENMEVSLIS